MLKKVKIVKVELLKFNKYLVKLSCGHWYINDKTLDKIKDLTQFVNCSKCKHT